MSWQTRRLLLRCGWPALLLVACHAAPAQQSRALTADDQRQLDEAAASLDANAITPDNESAAR